ncbi:hypothetical protein MIMGU_mgv1a024043mg, partial [Erythranthe guttata]
MVRKRKISSVAPSVHRDHNSRRQVFKNGLVASEVGELHEGGDFREGFVGADLENEGERRRRRRRRLLEVESSPVERLPDRGEVVIEPRQYPLR